MKKVKLGHSLFDALKTEDDLIVNYFFDFLV